MTLVVVVAVVALVAAALYLIHRERSIATTRIREHERLTRLHQQRETELLDRLAHAYDRPWAAPPVDEVTAPDDEEDEMPYLVWDSSYADDEVTGVSL